MSIDLDAIKARHTSENWQCCKDVAALLAEVERLRSHVARNGIEWCMCSRADRMHDRRISRCPYHGVGMAVQRNVAEQERDEARAALTDLRTGIEALWTELASAEPDVDQSARVVSRHVRDRLDALLDGAANV